jgi:FtsZ-interacting cell division protein ZipA
MWELRWILLGLGALLIGVVYLWTRRPLRISIRSESEPQERTEPSMSPGGSVEPVAITPDDIDDIAPPNLGAKSGVDRVITLRFMSKDEDELSCNTAILALRKAGLVHGKYGIFHYLPVKNADRHCFSVASLTEPGSFDLSEVNDATMPGMSFFMVLTEDDGLVDCFDSMVRIARDMAQELNGEIFDERGSSWSIQRERYVREEIIQYRHLLSRS